MSLRPSILLTHVALAIFVMSCAGAAAAQTGSSVTLYGVVDAAVRHVRNEGLANSSSLISGGGSTSRLGVRGSEDLGGGLSARFQLEHGMNLSNGQEAPNAVFWDRLSFIGLASTSLGELRLGKDYVPTYTAWVRHDPFSNVGVAGIGNLLAATPQGPIRAAFGTTSNPLVRSNGVVEWIAPAGLGGFEGAVMVTDATATQGRLTGLRAGYAAGPFAFTVAAARTRSLVVTGQSFKDHFVGASWDASVVKLMGGVREFSFTTSKQRELVLAATAPLGTGGQLKLSWQRADLDGTVGTTNVAPNGATQWGVGYVQELSKRSAVYVSTARIRNAGASTYTVPGGTAGLAAGKTSSGLELGVRHNF